MSFCGSQPGLLYPLRLGDEVNFRLTYDGPLKAGTPTKPRRLEKHAVRCVFNRQLQILYQQRRHVMQAELEAEERPEMLPVRRGDFRFLALVREKLNLVCDLDILFLRRDDPGKLIQGGGDLDNRIKTLFDALRIPQDDNEVRGLTSDRTESGNPQVFWCLTEDDKLITGFRVITDRLLEPPACPEDENHVRLVINVEVSATKLTPENMAYFSHF